MFVEAFIFRSHQRLDEIGREFIVGNLNPVFGVITSKHFIIIRKNSGRNGVVGVLDGVEVGHLAKEAIVDTDKKQHDQEDERPEDDLNADEYFYKFVGVVFEEGGALFAPLDRFFHGANLAKRRKGGRVKELKIEAVENL